VGGLSLPLVMMLTVGYAARCEYREAFNNPFTIVITVISFVLLLLGFQGKFLKTESEQKASGLFGIVGLFSLIAILTIEWFNYFEPHAGTAPAMRSITLFWTLYALLWIIPGFALRSMPIRICGLIVLFGTLMKTMTIDSTVSIGFCSWEWNARRSYEDWTLLANPYFLTMLVPVIPAMALAVWTNGTPRNKEPETECSVVFGERIAWKVAGVIGLIVLVIYLSIECYQYFDSMESKLETTKRVLGTFALTFFWTIVGCMITLLALLTRSKTLRIISMTIMTITAAKVLLLDFWIRPEYIVPIWNPYAVPILVLAAAIIALGYLWLRQLNNEGNREDHGERTIYRCFAFFGVFFLWLTMSAECFQAVRQLAGTGPEAWKAQMALSILWSFFAGVLIGVGFIWQSSVLRWMAIMLFAMTLCKILIIDMSGVNELYRFGAVFALATLLALATWAYQRFKPEA
jgi:uncharacterized membrane protein